MKQLILISFLGLFISSCNDSCIDKGGHGTLIVENRSNRNIETKITGEYPDTILYENNNPLLDQGGYVPANTIYQSKLNGPKPQCFENIFANGLTEWFYIFDRESLVALSWDTVRITGRGILERRAINLEYLQNNNFTIVYEE